MGISKKIILYEVIVFVFFLVGLFLIPQIPGLKESPRFIQGDYSFLSGVSLPFWLLLPILFITWLKSKKGSEIIGKEWLHASTSFLLAFSIFFYPPIMLFLGYWNPDFSRTAIALVYALLTGVAGFQVYILGLNSRYRGIYGKREEIIKFLLTSITLVSLTSVALTFVLSSSGYLVAMDSTYKRAVVTGAYCLIPIATYCLGYLAKMLSSAVAEDVGYVLSLILSFIIGASVLSVMIYKWYFFSAITPLFLVVGLILAFFEKSDELLNRSE